MTDLSHAAGVLLVPPPVVVLAAGFDPAKHPHEPGGSPKGGQWASTETTPTMGVGTPEQEAELRKRNAVPPLVEQQMEADLKAFLDDADLNMRLPEDAMLEVLNDDEFYNQHHQEAGSRGMGRSVEGEADLLGLPKETTAEGLPKYGYLGPDTDGVIGYGPIRVVFKDGVKDRATFTVNDSLMMGKSVIPSPVRDPSYLSAGLGHIEEVASAWAVDPDSPDYDPTSGDTLGMNERYGAESEDFVPNGDIWYSPIENRQTSIPYVEAQIYGKLAVSDIDHVEVLRMDDWDLEDPLTGLPQVADKEKMDEVLARLDELGIPWYEYEPPGDYSGEYA